jgi:hypothetical protein
VAASTADQEADAESAKEHLQRAKEKNTCTLKTRLTSVGSNATWLSECSHPLQLDSIAWDLAPCSCSHPLEPCLRSLVPWNFACASVPKSNRKACTSSRGLHCVHVRCVCGARVPPTDTTVPCPTAMQPSRLERPSVGKRIEDPAD